MSTDYLFFLQEIFGVGGGGK